jgi:hypothetical protein
MSHLPDFLEGAVDLHVHSAPDVDKRRFVDIELAREAANARMSAILIKSIRTRRSSEPGSSRNGFLKSVSSVESS